MYQTQDSNLTALEFNKEGAINPLLTYFGSIVYMDKIPPCHGGVPGSMPGGTANLKCEWEAQSPHESHKLTQTGAIPVLATNYGGWDCLEWSLHLQCS
ncbi:hypothetical protein LAh6_57 [Aeromonas phage LAh_6]|uniref:Uncharacterized protein n=2 Tax=Lahexavirus TaxID=2843411 RepID=A0A513ZZX5_9CAUD|nr:hypothetical protein HWC30_gp057 [Aeromonas phage LAh_6]QDH46574.1 hypothetical protein LAh6_57 [Aeromonas phage LAh_6]